MTLHLTGTVSLHWSTGTVKHDCDERAGVNDVNLVEKQATYDCDERADVNDVNLVEKQATYDCDECADVDFLEEQAR